MVSSSPPAEEDLADRTKAFSFAIIDFCFPTLPRLDISWVLDGHNTSMEWNPCFSGLSFIAVIADCPWKWTGLQSILSISTETQKSGLHEYLGIELPVSGTLQHIVYCVIETVLLFCLLLFHDLSEIHQEAAQGRVGFPHDVPAHTRCF